MADPASESGQGTGRVSAESLPAGDRHAVSRTQAGYLRTVCQPETMLQETERRKEHLYYSDEVIDKVRDATDIVRLIGASVRLKKAGRRYVGLCPFHNEKTPSFSVDPDRQMYYCFGCHKGGNVFTFLEEHDNMTFQEAVQTLAGQAGISLPEQSYRPGEKKARDEKMQILELNKVAATWFFKELHSPEGREGLSYLRGRKLTDETIQRFGLGFAPADSSSLYNYLKERGFSDKLIRMSGLMNLDELRGRMYDRFRNRVIFPILDTQNRVIGFGGRVMGDAKPKYLNSPESAVFDKSRNLYGYNVARRTRAGKLILCEGYMDVIAMHQAGFTYAVASLGTALTWQHCEIIRRFTKDVILSYDSDQAGTNAKMRAIPMLRKAGITPVILHLEPYKDPDEFIKAEGQEAFQKRLDQAENAFLFEAGVMQKRFRMDDPDGAADFYDALATLIASMDDVFKRKGYVRLAAEQYGIEETDLTDRVRAKLEKGIVDERYLSAARGGSSYNRDYGTEARPDEDSSGAAEASRETTGVEDDGPSYEDRPVPDYYEDLSTGDYYQIPRPATRRGSEGSVGDQSLEMSRRLLLSYIARYPSIADDIKPYIGKDGYGNGLAGSVAEILYSQLEEHQKADEAAVIARFEDTQTQARVAELFHTMDMAANDSERVKAIRETVRKVYEASPISREEGANEMAKAVTRKQKLNQIRTLEVHLS